MLALEPQRLLALELADKEDLTDDDDADGTTQHAPAAADAHGRQMNHGADHYSDGQWCDESCDDNCVDDCDDCFPKWQVWSRAMAEGDTRNCGLGNLLLDPGHLSPMARDALTMRSRSARAQG